MGSLLSPFCFFWQKIETKGKKAPYNFVVPFPLLCDNAPKIPYFSSFCLFISFSFCLFYAGLANILSRGLFCKTPLLPLHLFIPPSSFPRGCNNHKDHPPRSLLISANSSLNPSSSPLPAKLPKNPSLLPPLLPFLPPSMARRWANHPPRRTWVPSFPSSNT